MALADEINALPTTVGNGKTGHINNHQVIHAGLKNHESRLEGVENYQSRLEGLEEGQTEHQTALDDHESRLEGVEEHISDSLELSWNPSVPVYFWGDSAVYGGDVNSPWADGENLPSRLDALVDNEVVNRGQGGRTSNDVLLRAGVWRPAFTPTGGVLPHREYVDLTGHGLALDTRNFGAYYAGKLGQINGTLRYEPNVGWQFHRSDTKDPGTITKPLEFVSSLSVPPGAGTHIFLMAGNDWVVPDATGPEHDLVTHVVANYVRAVESVEADPIRHVLIGGVKSRRSTQPGDASHKFVTAVNNRLKAMFPDIFVDREAWLATRALAAAGISPTADDLAKMEAGIAPPSVFADGDDTHVRKEIVEAEARELWAPALVRKGWATLKSGVTIDPWPQPAFGGFATQSTLDLRVPVGAIPGQILMATATGGKWVWADELPSN